MIILSKSIKTKQMHVIHSFIVNIKTEYVYKDKANDVEKR